MNVKRKSKAKKKEKILQKGSHMKQIPSSNLSLKKKKEREKQKQNHCFNAPSEVYVYITDSANVVIDNNCVLCT